MDYPLIIFICFWVFWKRYGFDGKEIADKPYDFKFLEWKEKEFKDKHKKLSKRISKFKHLVPFTEGIGINELLALEIGIKGAAKYYNLPYVSAAMRLIEDIKTSSILRSISASPILPINRTSNWIDLRFFALFDNMDNIRRSLKKSYQRLLHMQGFEKMFHFS